MLKTLCLGGSFNPIHHGHLICARAAAEGANFDRVLLIPSSQPPHKPGDPSLADASHRLAMTRAAITPPVAQTPLFEVDGLEIGRAGLSYTIDTGRTLAQRGLGPVHWLIGADLLPHLLTWREPAALLEEITFWVIQRPGAIVDWSALPLPLRALRERLLVAPLIDISSTNIRQRVAMSRPIDFLTPPAVITYIREHRLYGWRENADSE